MIFPLNAGRCSKGCEDSGVTARAQRAAKITTKSRRTKRIGFAPLFAGNNSPIDYFFIVQVNPTGLGECGVVRRVLAEALTSAVEDGDSNGNRSLGAAAPVRSFKDFDSSALPNWSTPETTVLM